MRALFQSNTRLGGSKGFRVLRASKQESSGVFGLFCGLYGLDPEPSISFF